ncbi:hypothetical protein BDA96_06G096800 [Sorghum bicolor]|uniref:UPF3 domain-containing protein n=2 Tax=Sorghum bicolor TaxID=4558 RepID=A0A1B6PL15_SORBI|nr:regulator of nonsense transcripts UPF3 isoform X2 [Sorghum bicolor]KAG0525891.1 hypothetical protein BDA96_06G096800 [Sorghum bicolor]KXG26361.1 hypothetical protein SORBI_3006G088200 [Sorghum bicolor]OQU81627.1 hypothetical protein SORBI_3006G088200 [Sorghum bicolor]|eukprot:XP_021318865.1 regulator of nonsense transcripts UPF3 isoform X2 [Sorghum bicolor]
MKDPAHRTKVVLRRLPPAIAQQAVVDQVDARFAGRYDWACFRPGNASQKNHRYSRLYLNFKRPEDVVEFAEVFNGHVFVNEKGAQFKAFVEYSPSQQVPKSNIKKDGREGTIMKDPEYLEFLELISKPTEHLPSAEIQLERKEAERAAAGKEAPVVTPLMMYVRQQRAAKSMAQRPGSRLSRKVAGVVTSSSSPKRSSEKRRSSTYVVRDSTKEKPTYIMVPKREEHTHREKAIAGNSDATSGGTSGSGQAGEAKRDKIVILKGRGRVDSNTPDGATQQSSTPVKSVPPATSRLDQRPEASGRIIKTILSNKEIRSSNPSQHEQEGHVFNTEKDKRPPRAVNPRTIVKDQLVENSERSHFDEKTNHLHGSAPIGEKVERHARNRDRPDRGVWAPRRYDKSTSGGGSHASSSDFPQIQSHSGDNVSQIADGHGDRKTDTRGHGGSRGVPVENGHRHANRRGPPRGPKETEISASVPDGKNSKRGSASYGAHERQVWVQKSSSGS